jgi:polyhydroxyalkanoate synthesis regulator phasin
MSSIKNITMVGAGALGTAALALGAAGIAGAQEDDPTLETPAPAEETTEDRPTREERRMNRLDMLVEDGVITQEQADDLVETHEAIQAERQARQEEKLQGVADVLGVTTDDLRQAREDGVSLAELAGDDLPALVDYLTDQATEKINDAVAEGRITQEQADEKIDGLDERIEDRLENGGGFGKGKGRRGGHGHGNRGGGGGFGGGADAPAAEEVAA